VAGDFERGGALTSHLSRFDQVLEIAIGECRVEHKKFNSVLL
jgi:hypothetical protein